MWRGGCSARYSPVYRPVSYTHLDAKLRRALTKYTENAVVLIVAQRVSTIMNAEQIIVLLIHTGCECIKSPIVLSCRQL